MSPSHNSRTDQVIVALRRVIRSIELHSRSLMSTHGLTGPQATLLRALLAKPLTAGDLAEQVNLSQGTVTDILNRLEQRQLLRRTRDTEDRRRVIVELTDTARSMLSSAPPLLQERFSSRFNQLADWEQSLLLASLQRIAHMMDADESVPLAPFLTTAESIEKEERASKPPVAA
ncbi:MAG: hypothetical protein RLZZ385_802 [Pseudomonadota bacterium]|jgi:DNA-binding MarR family transcriptional regulator